MPTVGCSPIRQTGRSPVVSTWQSRVLQEALKAKDLFLAGWGMDRHIKEIAADIASTCINLISVSWSIQEMAEVVVSRLHIHRMEPDLKPLHLAIPARLLNKKQLLALAKKSRLFLQI